MLVPLFVLALGAVSAGWIGAEGTGGLHGFLAPVFAKTLPESAAKAGVESATFWGHYGLMIASGAISLVCMLIAYVLYVQQPWIPALIKATFGEAYRVLWNKYYFDELYEDLLVRPARGVARFLVGLDDYLIDGLLWLVTAVPRGAALALRTFQSGFVQGYALSMALGIAAMLLAVLWM
jgi:NADH-quinone oxidoreductase subunit L